MRNAPVLILLVLATTTLQAQEEFWKGDPIDLRLGLNNGIRKLFVEFRATPERVPVIRMRSRLIDPENIGKEVFTDVVAPGTYVYHGTSRRVAKGDDFLVHEFHLTGNRKLRLCVDIKSIASITLRELAHNNFDVSPEKLPFALVELFDGSRVLTYPLRDIAKWKGREEEALIRDEVPMEKTADRIEALRYLLKKLITHEDRAKRIDALRQIDFYSDEELDRAIGIFLQLRTDKDPEVAKAVQAFCIKRHMYSQQELMKNLFDLRGDDKEKWLATLDFLDEVPERDAARDAAPALKHFLAKEGLDAELAERARVKLDRYRKLLPPGAENARLPKVSAESGWLPVDVGEVIDSPPPAPVKKDAKTPKKSPSDDDDGVKKKEESSPAPQR